MKGIEERVFGELPDGRTVREFTLKNLNGFELSAINYGGIITRIIFPDRNGVVSNIVLGYSELSTYLNDPFYMGALVGRTSNRIKNGVLIIRKESHQLDLNNPPNHLHGGGNGFNTRFWEIKGDETNNRLKLSYLSPAGESKYPGNLKTEIIYGLDDKNNLKITYKASTDRPTPFSPTQHSYFNLSGNPDENILGHYLKIASSKILESDENQCTVDEFIVIKNGPFDFGRFRKIGERIDHEQLKKTAGYDHFYIFDENGDTEKKVELWHQPSGRYLSMKSDFPGMQVFTSNFSEKDPIQKYGAVCLETHFHPDSSRHENFPDWTLMPGEEFEYSTEYQFDIRQSE